MLLPLKAPKDAAFSENEEVSVNVMLGAAVRKLEVRSFNQITKACESLVAD
jgi:hypothetical protein